MHCTFAFVVTLSRNHAHPTRLPHRPPRPAAAPRLGRTRDRRRDRRGRAQRRTAPPLSFRRSVDAPGCTLSPGFVNAHAHLYGLLAHGLPLDKAPSGFWPFLEDFWWPLVEDRLDHEAVCAATDAILLEMLRSGVTTVYDCTEAPYALPGCLAAQAEVVRTRGIRAILSFEATERVSKENGQLGLRENADFIRACRETGGLVSGLMCFHTTFSCSAAFIQQAHRLGEELGVPVHMHCSEGVHEPEYALQHFGVRPMEYYDRLGVANTRMLASQCVQMSAAEIAIMAARGVKMTHMPLSNCEVGAGIAPVPELVAAGVTVGLGSDGYVNDFYEVVRATFLIHKAHKQDPRVMPAPLVWYWQRRAGQRRWGWSRSGAWRKAGRPTCNWSTHGCPHLPRNTTSTTSLCSGAATSTCGW
jgi:5-methylthioadenosine/S-adenosylhomocysteine deaminase